jgi:hypothetical protein
MEEKIADKCRGNGWHEVPHAGDDASYPRDWYSDTWDKGDDYARGKAVEGWLRSLGFFVVGDIDQTIPFCTGSCTNGKNCLPLAIESDSADTVTIQLVSQRMPGGQVKEMYWAFAEDRGVIKLRATTCKCVAKPI